jgi:tRNA threonylcarbamoyladenosine biosynthesis protein TsaB
MLLLALDTSTRQASVALCSESEVLAEYSWYVGNNHSVELLERIQRLSGESGKPLAELDAIAVATGPGSFNGVRVAVATAKSLAFALDKPLVGIATLDVVAAQQQQWQGPICAVLEAGRGELYAACYEFESQVDNNGSVSYSLLRLSDYQLLGPQQLSSEIQEYLPVWVGVAGERELAPILFCGEISALSQQALRKSLQELALFAGNLSSTRHASTLARLAMQRLASGNVDNPLSLEPFYLRRPSITTSTRKQPLLGSAKAAETEAAAQTPPTGQGPGNVSGPNQKEREEGALRH